jgi:HSP20 family protein
MSHATSDPTRDPTASGESATSPEETGRVSRLTYSPNVDIEDTGGELLITADVPGAKAEKIEVSFEDGVLAVHAPVEPRTLPGRCLRQEYGIGDYRRSFRLGEGFDASQITADARHGVLVIRVPRLAAIRPRKIEVRSS